VKRTLNSSAIVVTEVTDVFDYVSYLLSTDFKFSEGYVLCRESRVRIPSEVENYLYQVTNVFADS
tara:strand:+ start:261 stop:455 length:195 start_codon:yes stop_codon:yes gene_type:complete